MRDGNEMIEGVKGRDLKIIEGEVIGMVGGWGWGKSRFLSMGGGLERGRWGNI